jgi:hypothetical protein
MMSAMLMAYPSSKVLAFSVIQHTPGG